MRSSLILTTYKSPEFLDMVLASVTRQSVAPDEVIVAEDGEDARNVAVLKKWQTSFGHKLQHVTQKDRGNRKPLVMNKAVARSSGDYLIFVDADCVLRHDFVGEHLLRADRAAFLTGRRVELSAKATGLLNVEKIRSGYLDGCPWALYADALWGDTQSLGRFFKTPSSLRRLLKQDSVFDIRGCNFSVHREALVKINGFDNEFSGAYGEDSDAEYRLKFLGLEMKSVKGAAIQFHLWHATQNKDSENQERLQRLLKTQDPRARSGLAEAPQIP